MKEKLPFETWEYEEQTKIKHLVFADYFDKWIKILGKAHPLNYFDCFGGKGAYKEGDKICYGSPVLAAEIIKNNSVNLKREVSLVIIDKDQNNLKNIEEILKYKKLEIKPEIINKDFDVAINKMLDKHPNLAPTFFFVDPFGFKIKISTLKRMMEVSKSEILLTFMYNGIIRNLGIQEADNVLVDLFGSDEWKRLKDLESREKEKKIVELFRSKLKKFCKFVYPYRLGFPEMDRTYYYLFHLTNYYLGCEIMKGSFAKYNRGRIEYRGKSQNQMTFYDYNNVKIDEIRECLLSTYQGSNKLFIDVIKEQIDETPYLVKDIRQAIRELEKDGKVNILRKIQITKSGKPKISIENEDRIKF